MGPVIRPVTPTGTAATTDVVVVTDEMVATVIDTAGFVHPLFSSTNPERPLPGQAVLLLLGGMLERSGALDHATALLGFEDVKFRTMVRAGDQIRGFLEPVGARTTQRGSRIETFDCSVRNQREDLVLEARFQMLVETTPRLRSEGGAATREEQS